MLTKYVSAKFNGNPCSGSRAEHGYRQTDRHGEPIAQTPGLVAVTTLGIEAWKHSLW
jgi:hypothetical protein